MSARDDPRSWALLFLSLATSGLVIAAAAGILTAIGGLS